MDVLGVDLKKDVLKISREMGLPENFLLELKNDDDWSFVIKTHAFLEALISYSISEAIHRKELAETLSRLDMSNMQYGKVIISEKLRLIKADGKKFLLKFSSLRNHLVHNIRQINFSFSEHLKTLNKNQKQEFFKAFSYFACQEDLRDHNDVVADIVFNHTKVALWLSAIHFTGLLWWVKEKEKLHAFALAMGLTEDVKEKS